MSKKQTGKTLLCLHCAKSVYVPVNRVESFKYCSRSCLALASRIEAFSICGICAKQFTHISSRSNLAKYCSRSCYYKSLKGRGSVAYNCLYCQKGFRAPKSKNRKFCSIECRAASQLSTWSSSFAAARKAMFKRCLLESCHDCGYNACKDIIGVHHIDENRLNNTFENLVALCPNCHSIRHRKHIPH